MEKEATNRVVKSSVWFVINGAFLVLMYFGLVENINGAYNVLMVFSWFNIIVSLFLINKDIIKDARKKKKERSVPRSLNIAYDIGVVAFFAWYGNIFTAIGWLVHLLFQEAFWSEVAKEEKDV